MSKPVFVIPGFAGSELYYVGGAGTKLWVSPYNLVLGGLYELKLDHNGIDPGPPQYTALRPGPGLPEFFEDCATTLQAALADEGYAIIKWGWDWRQSIFAAGERLTSEIRQRATLAEPATLVAHSAGGLVCRASWRTLLADGDAGLVRRIITLGTPHRGAYAPIRVFMGKDPTITEIVDMVGEVNYWAPFLSDPFTSRIPGELQILQLFSSFPLLFELFPLLDTQAAIDDPARARLYDYAEWPASFGLSSDHWTRGRDIIRPFLLGAGTMPPPHILTTVAGTGVDTWHRLTPGAPQLTPEAIETTQEGDGVVALDSALVPGARQHVWEAAHHNLSRDVDILRALPDYVREVRTPAQPVPPPDHHTAAAPNAGNPPPFAGSVPRQTINIASVVPLTPAVKPPQTADSSPTGLFGSGLMFRVSIRWRLDDARIGSWTENFWCNVSSLDAAFAAGRDLGASFRLWHGRQCDYTHIRATQVPGNDGLPVPKVADSIDLGFAPKGVTGAEATDDADYPTTSIWLRMLGAGLKTHQWIKGIHDEFVIKSKLKVDHPGLVTAQGIILDSLKNKGFQIRTLNTANLKQIVKSIAADGTIVYAGTQFPDASKVRISGSQSNTYMNGIWRLDVNTVAGVTTTKLVGFNPSTPFIPMKGNVTIRFQSYLFTPISDIKPIYATEHKIGRPTNLHGGRPKKRNKTLIGGPAV